MEEESELAFKSKSARWRIVLLAAIAVAVIACATLYLACVYMPNHVARGSQDDLARVLDCDVSVEESEFAKTGGAMAVFSKTVLGFDGGGIQLQASDSAEDFLRMAYDEPYEDFLDGVAGVKAASSFSESAQAGSSAYGSSKSLDSGDDGCLPDSEQGRVEDIQVGDYQGRLFVMVGNMSSQAYFKIGDRSLWINILKPGKGDQLSTGCPGFVETERFEKAVNALVAYYGL